MNSGNKPINTPRHVAATPQPKRPRRMYTAIDYTEHLPHDVYRVQQYLHSSNGVVPRLRINFADSMARGPFKVPVASFTDENGTHSTQHVVVAHHLGYMLLVCSAWTTTTTMWRRPGVCRAVRSAFVHVRPWFRLFKYVDAVVLTLGDLSMAVDAVVLTRGDLSMAVDAVVSAMPWSSTSMVCGFLPWTPTPGGFRSIGAK